MRITDTKIDATTSGSRLSATIRWEDCARPDFDFELETTNAPAMAPDQAGNALATALFPLAFHDAERRVAFDVPVCPLLADNLLTALDVWNHWSGAAPVTFVIEAAKARAVNARRQRSTAFLSGGIDSFHLLHRNLRLHDRDQPAAIDRVILAYGFDLGKRRHTPEPELFAAVRARLAAVCAPHGVAVATAATNLRQVKPLRPGFWTDRYYGPAVLATGHAVAPGPGYLAFAGTYDFANLEPIGSNPIVDVQFSSQRLQIVHEGLRYSRLRKLTELTEWPAAIDNLRVCAKEGRHDINCGQCEKCVRTRLALLAVGVDRSQAFGEHLMEEDLLDVIELTTDYHLASYRDIVAALAFGPHAALRRRIEAKLAAHRQCRPSPART